MVVVEVVLMEVVVMGDTCLGTGRVVGIVLSGEEVEVGT